MEIKVILPIKELPEDSVVTKLTGTKKYRVRKDIRVYSQTGSLQTISAEGGSRLLLAENGDSNAINGDTEVIWITDVSNLEMWLETLNDDCFTTK